MNNSNPDLENDDLQTVVMSARSIFKSYGGIQALSDVDFDIRRGSVTVLFGENGAGKSTLMKILSGVESPTTGAILLDGVPATFESANEAARAGVAIIHQELNLASNLSITDNIFVGREEIGAIGLGVRFAAERRRAIELLQRLEEDLDPNTLVGDLRLGQQQIVEIAKALAGDARVLIMDEPTSALSSTEVKVLFQVIRELKADGVAIVYISHHLEEAIEIADYAVVLRDGHLVGKEDARNIDLAWVVEKMVGRSAEVVPVDLVGHAGELVLTINGLVVPDSTDPSRIAVNSFDLELRQGEIVCLYGLMGAGRTELLETIAGRTRPLKGTITLRGANITNLSIAERISLGLALVPEDRQRDGLVQTLSVAANLTMSSLTSFVRGLFLSDRRESRAVSAQISDVRLKAPRPSLLVTTLSGGNQQKVVIGRVLMTQPEVLLLDEPSRGIDVGAKAEIFGLMAREAKKGLAVLYATSEVSEALAVATRVIVMSRGSVAGIFRPGELSRERLMAASGEAEAGDPHAADLGVSEQQARGERR